MENCPDQGAHSCTRDQFQEKQREERCKGFEILEDLKSRDVQSRCHMQTSEECSPCINKAASHLKNFNASMRQQRQQEPTSQQRDVAI